MTDNARPYLGAGGEQVDLATIYQVFYDCKHGSPDVRVDAVKWLNICGRDVWAEMGLPADLFIDAYMLWVPEYLLSDDVMLQSPDELMQ